MTPDPEADRRRLDWLEKYLHQAYAYDSSRGGPGPTVRFCVEVSGEKRDGFGDATSLRAAIDAAMAEWAGKEKDEK